MFFVIKSNLAPMYEKPDEYSQRVDEVLHGMAASVLEDKGNWLRVRTAYRYVGWIHRRHLAPKRHGGDYPVYINAPAADVLTSPKVQAPILLCLPMGSIVYKIQPVTKHNRLDWTAIILADGSTGYVRSAFLSSFPRVVSREAIIETAKKYLGTQYRWGGKTTLGIDCSGLCFMAYWLNGIAIYRDAHIKSGFPIKQISPQAARKGDLLFFPGHVGMILDEDTMIHSSEANNGVEIEALTNDWRAKITAAGGFNEIFSPV